MRRDVMWGITDKVLGKWGNSWLHSGIQSYSSVSFFIFFFYNYYCCQLTTAHVTSLVSMFTGQISGYWPLISRYLCKQKQVCSINLHLFIPGSWRPTHNWCYVKPSYCLTTLQSEETIIWKISVFLKCWLIHISLYTKFTSKDDWCIIVQDSCGYLYLFKIIQHWKSKLSLLWLNNDRNGLIFPEKS